MLIYNYNASLNNLRHKTYQILLTQITTESIKIGITIITSLFHLIHILIKLIFQQEMKLVNAILAKTTGEPYASGFPPGQLSHFKCLTDRMWDG